jgi:hypothetical protein
VFSIFKWQINNIHDYKQHSIDLINVIGNRLIAESGDSKPKNSFSRGFPLPFNVETLQAFGALF